MSVTRGLLAGQVACAALVLLGLVVIDQELAVLAVTMRLVASDADHLEDRVGLAEDGIHLLQGAVCGHGVEEVDGWDDSGVAGLLASFGFIWPPATYISAK